MKRIFQFLFRGYLLYLLAFLVLIFAVDYNKIARKTVDFYKDDDIPRRMYAASVEGKPLDGPFLSDAIRYYKHFGLLGADKAAVYNAIGYCYYQSGDFGKAIKYFDRAVQEPQSFFGFRYNLAAAYVKTGRMEEARKNFRAAAEESLKILKWPSFAADPFMAESRAIAQASQQDLLKAQILVGHRRSRINAELKSQKDFHSDSLYYVVPYVAMKDRDAKERIIF